MMRVLLIEDEPFARADLRALLGDHRAKLTIVGEADSVATATPMVRQLKPDLVFLDVELGDGSGFDLLGEIPAETAVVFVTAFDRYALRAFEVNALDYLLKPVNAARLELTIERLEDQERPTAAALPLRQDDRLLLIHDKGRRFVRLDQIVVVRSLGGNYTTVELEDGSVPAIRRTLKAWEDRLPKAVFRRVHRGTIANLLRVERLERTPDGTLMLLLRNRGEPLSVSRRRSAEVQTALAVND